MCSIPDAGKLALAFLERTIIFLTLLKFGQLMMATWPMAELNSILIQVLPRSRKKYSIQHVLCFREDTSGRMS